MATAAPTPAKLNVVLVHGWLNNGRIFGPMARVLEQQGYTCFAPDLTPNDGRLGIRQLTVELAGKIDARFGPGAPVVLVGFSMGGLVARDYVEHVAADPGRVRGVFLISSGGAGTLWANLSPEAGQRDMAVGSPFLRTLNADDAPWKTIPLHAYWTPLDLMIVPAVNSRWPGEGATRVWCPVHPWMPRNREVIADIAARLRGLVKGWWVVGCDAATQRGGWWIEKAVCRARNVVLSAQSVRGLPPLPNPEFSTIQ